MVKTIKISDENYQWLMKLAGKLQHERATLVSLDGALSFMHKSRELHDLAGSWQAQEKNIQKAAVEIKDRWKSWSLKYLAKKGEKL